MAEKSEKMTKQELRAPDAFQLYGAEASDWLMKRQQYIGGAVALLIVVGLVAGVVHYFSSRGEEKASKELGQALQLLERPVVEGAAPKPADSEEEPPFKSAKEKDEAIVSSLSTFRTAHKGTDASATAALPLAKAAYRLGQYDVALGAFEDFIKSTHSKDPLLATAREGQGYTYEAKAELDKAYTSFQEMEKVEAGEFMQGMGKYHEARILVEQGKKDEAAQLLSELKSTQGNSAAGKLATERLAVLAAEGVKLPEPKPVPVPTQTQDAG